MRILGIDFGEKRVGLAISDPSQRLSTPYATLHRTNDRQLLKELVKVVAEEEISSIVLGRPVRQDGTEGSLNERIAGFGRKLEERLELPVEFVDETLTSVEAASRLRNAGVNVRKHRERVDAVAAQIILQEALDSRKGDTP